MSTNLDAIERELEALDCALSPENLHCDGEISRAQARQKEKRILARIAELNRMKTVNRQYGG